MAALSTRMSRRRTTSRAVELEQLESRQCLSYSMSEYYPLGGGQTWNYSGTADGFAATATMFADSGFSEGGVSTTRLLTQIHDVNGTFTNSRFWNLGGSGLKILREDHAQSTQTDRYGNGGVIVATATVDAGQIVPYSSVISSTVPTGSFQQAVQGSVTFYGEESITTPAGTFMALKFTQNGSASVIGSSAHGTRTETQWVVKGLGIARLQYTEVNYYANGTQATDTVVLNLTGATLLHPVIAVSGNGQTIAKGDGTPTAGDGSHFGSVDVQNGTQTRVFTITNTGTQTLSLSGLHPVTITGANAVRFTVVGQPPASIAPGTSAQFSVRFAPGGMAGTANATVSIASSDPASTSYTFAVRGVGVSLPHARISGNQMTIADGDAFPTTADWSKFGGIDALYGTKVRIFTITNTGSAPLTLVGATSVSITGSDATRFAVFVQPATTVAPGGSTQFRVRFTPGGQVGFANATIHVASNDTTTPDYTFAIQGNGLALPRTQVSSAEVVIAAGDLTPNLTDKTDFGSVVTAGTANRVRLFTITNIGLATLSLTGLQFVTIAGVNLAEFAVSLQPSTSSIAPGASVSFRVRFDPTAVGSRSALLVIDTNENPNLSPSAGHYAFAIAGTGS